MECILVPCDFSASSEAAFQFAVSTARRSSGEIHVLYVIDITFPRGKPSLANSYAFDLDIFKELENESQKKFTTMRDTYAPGNMIVKFTHRVGSLNTEIEDYIQAHEIDLVVMGTCGQGGALIGSNTARVVRHSPVPVMAIHTPSEKDIHDIVLPVLPEYKHSDLVDHIKKLQRFFHARLHLLYVNTPLFFRSDRDAMGRLVDYAREFDISNCTLNVRADYTIEEGIIHFSREVHADMIAMGTHGWTGVSHFLIGSVAEDVVNHLSIPVWTYRIR